MTRNLISGGCIGSRSGTLTLYGRTTHPGICHMSNDCGMASPRAVHPPRLGLLKASGKSVYAYNIFPVAFNPYFLYYSSLLSQLRSLCFMRLIALVPVALVVSTPALPRTVFERDLGKNAGRDSDTDPQTSHSKCNELSLSSLHSHRPSSVGPTGDFCL